MQTSKQKMAKPKFGIGAAFVVFITSMTRIGMMGIGWEFFHKGDLATAIFFALMGVAVLAYGIFAITHPHYDWSA